MNYKQGGFKFATFDFKQANIITFTTNSIIAIRGIPYCDLLICNIHIFQNLLLWTYLPIRGLDKTAAFCFNKMCNMMSQMLTIYQVLLFHSSHVFLFDINTADSTLTLSMLSLLSSKAQGRKDF